MPEPLQLFGQFGGLNRMGLASPPLRSQDRTENHAKSGQGQSHRPIRPGSLPGSRNGKPCKYAPNIGSLGAHPGKDWHVGSARQLEPHQTVFTVLLVVLLEQPTNLVRLHADDGILLGVKFWTA